MGGGDSGRARPASGRSQVGLRGLRPPVAAAQVLRDTRMYGWLLLVLCALLPATAAGSSGRSYPHRVVLDPEGKYWLLWGRQGERLAFRLEVRTNGYVGFGFSPTGTMAAADIVVGGVAHGRPYLQVSLRPFGELPELGSLRERDGRQSPPKREADTGSAQQSPSHLLCHLLPQGYPSPPWGRCLCHLQSSPGGSFPPREARILVPYLTRTGHTFPSTPQERKDHSFGDLTGRILHALARCESQRFSSGWFWGHSRSRDNIY